MVCRTREPLPALQLRHVLLVLASVNRQEIADLTLNFLSFYELSKNNAGIIVLTDRKPLEHALESRLVNLGLSLLHRSTFNMFANI